MLVIVDGQVPGGEFAGLGDLGIGQGVRVWRMAVRMRASS